MDDDDDADDDVALRWPFPSKKGCVVSCVGCSKCFSMHIYVCTSNLECCQQHTRTSSAPPAFYHTCEYHIMILLIISLLVLTAVLVVTTAFVVVPLVLAIITVLRQKGSTTIASDGTTRPLLPPYYKSGLYSGRVWHTRFLPKVHSFTYPIFMFAFDLEETTSIKNSLWPLSTIISFRDSDHLINGEGLITTSDGSTKEKEAVNHDDRNHKMDKNSLANRVLRLVAQRTENKFQPTLETHRVILLTHLCYYGYNFNPVSFYYIVERSPSSVSASSPLSSSSVAKQDEDNTNPQNPSEKFVAVVGEVSNTPWQEMFPYVLHPDSVDQVELPPTRQPQHKHYVFPKVFHVSPFMEMEYFYDWKLEGVPSCENSTSSTSSPIVAAEGAGTSTSTSTSTSPASLPLIKIVTSMRQRENRPTTQFTATLKINRQEHILQRPLSLAWQTLIRYPMYCMIIQIWIHYEAAWLFVKGISYIPHPDEAETTASRMIATIMTPFFAIRDAINPKSKTTTKKQE